MSEDLKENILEEDEVVKATKEIKRSARKKAKVEDDMDDDTEWSKSSSTWSKVVSTGSTLLDLAISGTAIRGGGLPGGFILEISGESGSGKTTIGCEVVANAQKQGGECVILDPECRLTPEYCRTMGVKLNREDYYNPDTVEEVFEFLIGPLVKKSSKTDEESGKAKRDFSQAWKPSTENINICLVDSIAALAGEMELNQGDAMGGNRPRQFSQGFRLSKNAFRKNNAILFLTNQLRDNMSGYGKKKYAAGGNATKFYSSVRIELSPPVKLKTKERKDGRDYEAVYGISSEATVIKNSLDVPFRTAPIYLTFHHGIDNIRANLQFLKDNGAFDIKEETVDKVDKKDKKEKKASQYIVGGNKYTSMNDAIKAVEDNNLENEIANQVIDLWEEIQNLFKTNRKPKH